MPKVVIVGAGPAGMLLAHQLVGRGVEVHVLERARSFERTFRGEFLQPSGVSLLEDAGVLPRLVASGAATPLPGVTIFDRGRAVLRMGPGPGAPHGPAAVSQPALLALLDEECRALPGYRLDLGATVEGLARDGERVTGVRVRGQDEVAADLVVVTAGRRSALRKEAGLEAVPLEADMKILWVRLPAREDAPAGLETHLGRSTMCVLYPSHGGTVQVALCRRSADADVLQVRDAAGLRELLARELPERHRALADVADDGTERQAFQVGSDRLERWHLPGLLFLGDAAHTFGAVGGIGVNMALRDAAVAAHELASAVATGRPLDDACRRIEEARLPETVTLQKIQAKITRLNWAPPVARRLAFTMFPILSALGLVKPQLMQQGIATVRARPSAGAGARTATKEVTA